MNRIKTGTAGLVLASAVALTFLATPSHAQDRDFGLRLGHRPDD